MCRSGKCRSWCSTIFDSAWKENLCPYLHPYPHQKWKPTAPSAITIATGTAQLPQISLDAPKSVIGKNTVDCMRSGVVFGNASMIDGMIDRFKEELEGELTLIATGGLSKVIIPHCKHTITMDENIVLDGLRIIYNKNKK